MTVILVVYNIRWVQELLSVMPGTTHDLWGRWGLGRRAGQLHACTIAEQGDEV